MGEGGLVYRFDGSEWSEMDSGTTEMLRAVHGTSATDVFAVGLNGAVVHYGCEHGNPSEPSEPPACDWVEVPDAGDMGEIDGVWVGDTGLPYVAGSSGIFHFAGLDEEPESLWTTGPRAEGLSGVDGTLFVVGAESLLLGCDDTACTSLLPSGPATYQGVFALSESEVYVTGGESGGEGFVGEYNGDELIDLGVDLPGIVRGIWGTSTDQLVAVGDRGVTTYDGSRWTTAVENSDSLKAFQAVAGAAADDVYAVASAVLDETESDHGDVWHFDGLTWQEIDVDPSVTFYDVYVASEDDVYAAGCRVRPVEGRTQGVVYHFDGTAWVETAGCFDDLCVGHIHGHGDSVFVSAGESSLFRYTAND